MCEVFPNRMMNNILKLKLKSFIYYSDISRYIFNGINTNSHTISSFSGVCTHKKADENSKKSASNISSSNSSMNRINGNRKSTGTRSTTSAENEKDKNCKHSTVSKNTRNINEDRIGKSAAKTKNVIPFIKVIRHEQISKSTPFTNSPSTIETKIKEDVTTTSASTKTTVSEDSESTEIEVKVPLDTSQKVSSTMPLPTPIIFSEIQRKKSTDTSSPSQDETSDSESKHEDCNANETSPDSENSPTAPAVNSISEVPGLSANVVKVPDHPVGPKAAKNSTYKNPEYFCYQKYSFNDALVELSKFRLPQPSIHEQYYHECK
ncbi:mucin-2-like [Diorhabda carinulata]|uniref:mucin-2-like n=1 Tax=Diorhabda carinulata TaxID=1163345 RepID=UPI0025A2E492|nr:mucin-2-like [Diorhabda carinulata]